MVLVAARSVKTVTSASFKMHQETRRAETARVDGEMRTTDLPVATKFDQDFSPLTEHSQLVNEALLAKELTVHRSHAPRERTLIALDLCHAFRALPVSLPVPLEV